MHHAHVDGLMPIFSSLFFENYRFGAKIQFCPIVTLAKKLSAWRFNMKLSLCQVIYYV